MTAPESLSTVPPGLDSATLDFERAFSNLTQTLQAVLATTSVHERVSAAYLEYAGFVQAALAGHDAQQQASRAYAYYLQALQAALSSAPQRRQALDAFERYAHEVRDAWAGIDPAVLTPSTVAAIAQQLLTAASTVAGIPSPQTTTSGDVSPPASAPQY